MMGGIKLESEIKIKKPKELTTGDYQKVLDKLAELKPLAQPVNSARINDAVDKLERMVEEELFYVSRKKR